MLPADLIAYFGLAVLVLLLSWLVARYAVYKASHPYTEEDVKRARAEAITASRRIRAGQAAEQLAPFLPLFCEQFNPKDARFLGNPVDFIIFDGLEEGDLRQVVFLEIKSGLGNGLNKNERQVKRVIGNKEIRFEILNPTTQRLAPWMR